MSKEGAPKVETQEELTKRYEEISRATAFFPWFAVSPELKKVVGEEFKKEQEELMASGVSEEEARQGQGSSYSRKDKMFLRLYGRWLEESEELKQKLDAATVNEIDRRMRDEVASKYASSEIFEDEYKIK